MLLWNNESIIVKMNAYNWCHQITDCISMNIIVKMDVYNWCCQITGCISINIIVKMDVYNWCSQITDCISINVIVKMDIHYWCCEIVDCISINTNLQPRRYKSSKLYLLTPVTILKKPKMWKNTYLQLLFYNR